MNKLIIAGDIGGTKTLLQVMTTDGKQFNSLYARRFVSADYEDFKVLLREFLQASHTMINGRPITAMCLGIAGPVKQRTAQVTNLPWLIDADILQQEFDISRVELINDFMAAGYGIDMLQQSDLHCLQTGTAVEQAPRVIIGAGTGLGEGYLVWIGDQYIPFASEGGHADFAPVNSIQWQLLSYLQAKFGHVSYERVVSGSGLVNIFEFLTSMQPATAALDYAIQTSEDKAATIATFAIEQKDLVARQSLDIFIECYGAQAGNLALTCLARGGVYIAGGIAPKLIERIGRGEFMRAFRDKGRFASLMESIPVHVIMNAEAGLKGAILLAMQCL